MSFTRETPIHEIAAAENMSVRALNVCLHHDITSLGDLLSYTPEALVRFRNCGRKSSTELAAIISKYKDVPKYVLESDNTQTMLEALPLALEQWRLSKPPHVAAMVNDLIETYGMQEFVNRLVKNQSALVDELDGRHVEPRFRFLSNVIEFARQWDEHIFHCTGWTSEVLHTFIKSLTGRRQAYIVEERFAELPQVYKSALQDNYRDGFSQLSVRSQNAFKVFSDVEDAISFVVRNVPLSRYRIRGCGAVSRAEFSVFIGKFRSEIIPLLSRPDDDALKAYLDNYMVGHVKSDFPFLSEEEARDIAMCKSMDRPVPIISMLIKFIRRSELRSAKAYRLVYGFDAGSDGATLEDVGRQLGISGERVRQLAMKKLPFPEKLLEYTADVLSFIDSPVMPDYQPVWKEIIEREALDVDARRLMALVCALDDNYTVVSLAEGAHSYLVRKDLLHNVKVMTSLRELLKRHALRKTRDDVFSIEPYVRLSQPKSMFHPDLRLIYPIFIDYLCSLDGVSCTDGVTIVLSSNKLSVEDCIVNLLEENGSSMSYRQILDEFVRRYPDFKMGNATTLRSYILRSERILPVGRSGRYVLSTWKDIFTGSLTEFMVRCLRESESPLSLDELYRKALAYFPDTTEKSLTTLIYLDKGENFVTLGAFLYGLKGREYPDLSPDVPRSITRMPFHKRFEQVKEFVAVHRRMPMNFSDSECTLWHWLENVEAGNITYTQEEWLAFKEFRKENMLLPQSAGELRFMNNCVKIKEIVEDTGKLPSIRSHQFEYTWFNRNRRTYGSVPLDVPEGNLPDNRSRFFADLLRFIAGKGIKLR